MKKRYLLSINLSLIMFLFLVQAIAYAAVIRVKPGGNDANSGGTWALAKKTVSGAISAANQGDEIWVAAGTYPEHIKNKVISDVAVDVALYGGFAGTEEDRDQRNWNANITILDGGGGDFPMPPEIGSVVYIHGGATQATRIDGFVIIRGHDMAGGGISILGAAPTIINNTIWNNQANAGGGILILNYKVTPPKEHPVITQNVIMENYAIETGGGIAVIGSEHITPPQYGPVMPTITGNTISRNVSALNGGGISIHGHVTPYIANNKIIANMAAYAEANFLGKGGAIYATKRDLDESPIQYAVTTPTIANNVIAANGAGVGGGIMLLDTDPEHGGIPVVTNNTIAANNGSGIVWHTTSPMIRNNLIAYNTWGLELGDTNPPTATIGSNCVYGNTLRGQRSDYQGIPNQTGLNGNISVDPLMANYKIGNFHLQPGSLCIDAGATAAVQPGWTDIDGQSRIIGGGVDIGADESDGTTWNTSTPVIYVKTGGNDANDGLSWQTAKRTVVSGILKAYSTGGEVWIAAGTYQERILLPAFVYLYGGFAGTETSRLNRDIVSNPTILDGGGIPTVVMIERAGYLVSAVDGFTIQNGGVYTGGVPPGGNAGYGGLGGGIYCQVSSPYIENNTIRRNSLGNPFDNANKLGYGGGIYTYLSSAFIRKNVITENEIINIISGKGGGIYFIHSAPVIEGNTITQNRAVYGTAIFGENSDPWILGNIIENNFMYVLTPLYKGATEGAISLKSGQDFLIQKNLIRANIASAGAGICVQSNLAGRILNNLIINNEAKNPLGAGMGGGIYLQTHASPNDDIYIVNNTIAGNTATAMFSEWGGGIALSLPAPLPPPPVPPPGRAIIANNVIAFNSSGIWQYLLTPMLVPTLLKNDAYQTDPAKNYLNLSPGASDIHVDPLFTNRPSGNFHLQPNSLCIDAGGNSSVPSSLTTDFEGNPRISHGKVDIGAYEFYRPILVDFDNDGKTDIAIWRPGDGYWYILGSQDGIIQTQWGSGALDDIPVPGDYDGDGKTDIAVWRPGDGYWYIIQSSDDVVDWYQWGSGALNDVPVPGDYDGDGKTDCAVWRPGDGYWYILGTKDGIIQTQWGTLGDIPVPGDYDGDGKTDIAVWRPGDGYWYIIGSKDGIIQKQWGTGTLFTMSDIPVPGDYDGDGKTDIAVWRPGDGYWYIIRSSNQEVEWYQWGLGALNDVPVPGDYDGDGKTDCAVWRPGDGYWYILGTKEGVIQVPWGAGWLNDEPISQ